MWMVGAQVLDPSSAAFPGTAVQSWIRSTVIRSQIGTLIWGVSIPPTDYIQYCTTSPLIKYLFKCLIQDVQGMILGSASKHHGKTGLKNWEAHLNPASTTGICRPFLRAGFSLTKDKKTLHTTMNGYEEKIPKVLAQRTVSPQDACLY